MVAVLYVDHTTFEAVQTRLEKGHARVSVKLRFDAASGQKGPEMMLCSTTYWFRREGNEISLIDILSTDEDDVLDRVQLRVDQAQLREKFACLSNASAQCWNCATDLAQDKRSGRSAAC